LASTMNLSMMPVGDIMNAGVDWTVTDRHMRRQPGYGKRDEWRMRHAGSGSYHGRRHDPLHCSVRNSHQRLHYRHGDGDQQSVAE
jgi:hypothetical protein